MRHDLLRKESLLESKQSYNGRLPQLRYRQPLIRLQWPRKGEGGRERGGLRRERNGETEEEREVGAEAYIVCCCTVGT
jgi:hypothetical protein